MFRTFHFGAVLRLFLWACLAPGVVATAQAGEERVLVEFNRPFSLQTVGGPNMDLIFKADQPTSFTLWLVDHDNLVPRVQQTYYRHPAYDHPTVELVPTIQAVKLPKRDGLPGDGLSKLYPILRTESGDFRVFFHDRLSVPQNQRELVIRTKEE